MSKVFASPEFAELGFYEAINRGDLKAMMGIWAEDDEIVCIHPTGQPMTGIREIRDGWQSVLNQNLRVEMTLLHAWQSTVKAVHLVQETLFVGNDPTPHGPLLSTNVYVRGPHGWRMVLHHSSAAIDTPHAVPDGRVLH